MNPSGFLLGFVIGWLCFDSVFVGICFGLLWGVAMSDTGTRRKG